MGKKVQAIVCTLENGETWAIPLSVVADDRAKYYAKKDPDTTYKQEYDYVMGDNYEGIDWFCNNMNPDEVEEHFRKVKDADDVDFNDKINASEKDLREIEFKDA